MECNECEKEVASIYMVCPNCFDAKDKEIAALQAQLSKSEKDADQWAFNYREILKQLADREARLALWRAMWKTDAGVAYNLAIEALKAKGEI